MENDVFGRSLLLSNRFVTEAVSKQSQVADVNDTPKIDAIESENHHA